MDFAAPSALSDVPPLLLQFYWMGLQSDRRSYPKFRWMDPMTPTLSLTTSYKHWGEGRRDAAAVPVWAAAILPLDTSCCCFVSYASKLHHAGTRHHSLARLPGLFMPANVYEPYAFNPPEYCGGGNFTEIYQSASGWADTSCDEIHIFICQVRRKLAMQPALGARRADAVQSAGNCRWRPCECRALQLMSLPSDSRTAVAHAAPTIGKYTVSNVGNATISATGELELVDGKPPLDPQMNLIYNDKQLNWEESITECNKMCAHLATFVSQADQHEAEKYFIDQVGMQRCQGGLLAQLMHPTGAV